MTNWIEIITGSLEQKRRYRQYKARMAALPEPYGAAARALQRYLLYYAGVADGETTTTMMGDAVELWERAATDGTPVGTIVGTNPVGFAEAFAQAYRGTHWIDKERTRLTTAINHAQRGESR